MTMQQTFPEAKSIPPEKTVETASGSGETAVPEILEEAGKLVAEIDKLLNNYKPLVDLDGTEEQLQHLKELSETYRAGVEAADRLGREGSACVADLRDRTKLAAEEMQRLADDGGPPPTKQQEAEIEILTKAARKLDKIAPVLERHFGDATKEDPPDAESADQNAA